MGCTSYSVKAEDLVVSVWFPFVVVVNAFGTEESGTLFTVAIGIGVVTVITGDMLMGRCFLHQMVHLHQIIDNKRRR